MNNFLHSLPWTVALALAQAGEEPPVSRLQSLEDSFTSSASHHSEDVAFSSPAPLALNGDDDHDDVT